MTMRDSVNVPRRRYNQNMLSHMITDNHRAYTPFPSFAEWTTADVSYRDVDAAARRFSRLKDTVSSDVLDLALEKAVTSVSVVYL